MKSRLPAFCSWLFAASAVLGLVAAGCVAAMIVFKPAPASLLSVSVDLSTRPGSFLLQADNGASRLMITGLQVAISGHSDTGLVQIARRYILPIALLYSLYFTLLFWLLHRLFHNVRRGNSFTLQTIGLVRFIGFSLLGFSLLAAAVESYLSKAVIDYLLAHVYSSAYSPVLSWQTGRATGGAGQGGSPIFLAGLLVLALSEVFRQGLKLKNDSELTI